MAEKLTLTVPDKADAGIPDYEIIGMNMWRGNDRQTSVSAVPVRADRSWATFTLIAPDGRLEEFSYHGVDADDKLTLFNTFNFSSGTSMHKKILNTLKADFPERLAGTVSGTPA